MFQSKEYIEKRHGKTGTDRAFYLNQLVKEYKATTSEVEAKQQVLANLANFAYDPVNYDTLWDLNVVDLFLEATTTTRLDDVKLQEFGLGGLANLCLDPRFRNHIVSNPAHLISIIACLQAKNPNNVLVNAMTTLMQLVTEDNYTTILTEDLRKRLLEIHQGTKQRHTKTMAAVFLLDYYHIAVVEEEDGHLPSSLNS